MRNAANEGSEQWKAANEEVHRYRNIIASYETPQWKITCYGQQISYRKKKIAHADVTLLEI